ncbi:hypothetical protein AA313_de0208644 [Arthrobotrys entomopaga]|nr:hypothetical protein AA313_de0208644 [Arthrobotrys entomopaga]
MHFFKIALTTALGLLSVPVLSQLTAPQVVANIQNLTAKSQALQTLANSVTLLNGPLSIIGQGPIPKIIAGFADIVSTVTADIAEMKTIVPFGAGADSDNIFNAFKQFVGVHQQLLNILIGKARLFKTVPIIGQPVANILRRVEAVVDAVAQGLSDTVQSRSADIGMQASSLDSTILKAIESYEGLTGTKVVRRHVKDFRHN